MPDNREIRLLDFIDNIENEEKNKRMDADYRNSDTYKLRMIDKSRDEAKKNTLLRFFLILIEMLFLLMMNIK